jgi:hypothetical protein
VLGSRRSWRGCAASQKFHLGRRGTSAGARLAKAAPEEQARNLEPLVLLNLSRLRQKQDREHEARQLHEQAIPSARTNSNVRTDLCWSENYNPAA